MASTYIETAHQVLRMLRSSFPFHSVDSSRTDVVCHDVDVGNAEPVKQYPYRIHPEK